MKARGQPGLRSESLCQQKQNTTQQKAEVRDKALKRAVATAVSPRANHSWLPVTLLRPLYLTSLCSPLLPSACPWVAPAMSQPQPRPYPDSGSGATVLTPASVFPRTLTFLPQGAQKPDSQKGEGEQHSLLPSCPHEYTLNVYRALCLKVLLLEPRKLS